MNQLPELHTERLLLAIPGASAAKAQAAYYARNREHLREWEPPIDDRYCDPAFHEPILDNNVLLAHRGQAFRFLIFERETGLTGDVLGHINLHNVTRGICQWAILGYSVTQEREGTGLITEAGRALIRFAFEDLTLHRLDCNYQPHNTRSAAVARKLGFEINGMAKEYLFLNGAWRDHVLTSLINPNRVTPA